MCKLRALFVSLVAVLGLCNHAGAAEKFTVILAQTTISVNEAINTFVPKHLGYFKEADLDVELQTSAGGTQIIQLLTAGRAQIGLVSAPSLIIARQKGVPVVAVYNYQRKHATAIAVAAEGKIKEPKDLRGKRIGMFSMTSMRTFDGKAMIKAAGLDPDKDVTWVPVGFGAQAAGALTRGDVDALTLWDSTYVDIENLGVKLKYYTFPFQDDLVGLGYITTHKVLASQRDTLIRYLRAVAKATVFAQANPKAAVCAYYDATGDLRTASNKEKTIQDALNLLKSNLANLELPSSSTSLGSYPGADVWKSNEKYYRDIGIVDKELAPSEYFVADTTFYDAINKFDRQPIVAAAHSYSCRSF
jgi:NitT/TauT family transport system substrate-binding protein